ncbi:MAG: ROK family protein [Methanomicrobium sp.]|nr:ROK family protein [Methanomicrobium sp.]
MPKDSFPDSVIAVDLGGSNLRAALFDGDEIVRYAKTLTPREGGGPAIYADAIIDLIRSNLSAEEIASAKAIGVSVPGPLDMEKGELINSPNLLFPVIPIKAPLEDEFGKPVVVMNDTNCGVLGEVGKDGAGFHNNAGPDNVGHKNVGSNNVVYNSKSTGIGGGIFADGHLLLGSTGNAGEVGHLFVDDIYSVRCSCGHTGHWEGYASGRGIPHFFRAYCRKNHIPMKCSAILPTAEDIFAGIREELSRNGGNSDGGCDRSCDLGVFAGFYEELSKINARAVSSIIAAYSPAAIILDGSVAVNNGELIIAGILKYIDRYLPTPEIRLSRLEGKAPLYGAAYCCALSLRGYNVHGENRSAGTHTQY